MSTLPPLAPYPKAAWRHRLSPQEWDALVDGWIRLSRAYLALQDRDFQLAAASDESVATFVSTLVEEAAVTNSASAPARLLKPVFRLASRLLELEKPPSQLLQHQFLSGLARILTKARSAPLISHVFAEHAAHVEASLASLKKLLVPHLESAIKGDLNLVESALIRVNPLLHVSPHACTFLLAGSDFFDGLVTCFRVMNPPLRKVIITTTYLCLVGLTKAEPPKWAMLSDQLFALKSAADSHKQGPLNANDSLVAELVTATPLLRLLLRRADGSDAAMDSIKKRVTALEPFRKGAMLRPKRPARTRVDKGKGRATETDAHAQMHIHRVSQIAQVQDLFPDLGSGFVARCLDEYGDDVEQVVANLLGETLPSHLAMTDRSEKLSSQEPPAPRMAPRLQLTARRNVFDDDDFDQLTADVSRVSFGKKSARTVDDMLKDKAAAPGKAAILSALAAFDSDEDERDDTYDATDVGGTVDSNNQEADAADDANEEALFRAYQTDRGAFGRDAATRRGQPRANLRRETGMADEAIEGWALMLARSPQQQKRLEAKYAFAGQQSRLERTAWRATPAGSGADDSDADAGAGGGARGGTGDARGGGRGRGRGRGRGGAVAGPAGDKGTEAARRSKEAHKGARANHNRREGRARKMARAGFPA